MTNYVGELVQHDTSYHLWAPLAERKWYLITSLDDYSRYLFYAELWEKESSWAHIIAVKAVTTGFGCPSTYYVDSHSIFRYIERRDTIWRKSQATEEGATVQWKEVLTDLGIDVIYALSPQAKGKIERPYRWIQDHLVRTCTREGIKTIDQAREILAHEVQQYNHYRVHSTTGEIPGVRFDQAMQEQRTLLRPFKIKAPYQMSEDIFCYRIKRVVDPYRKISLNKLKFSVSGVLPRNEVELRISFNLKTGMATIRIWYNNHLAGQHQVKAQDLKGVQF